MSNRSYVRPSPNDAACDVYHLHPGKVAALKRALIAEESVGALAETFKLLGDATRVRILDALAHIRGIGAPGSDDGLCVCDLATLLGQTQSAVSHQLRLLRGMRLVRSRRDGRRIFYALDDQHIVALFAQGLEHVEERAGVAEARDRGSKRVARRA